MAGARAGGQLRVRALVVAAGGLLAMAAARVPAQPAAAQAREETGDMMSARRAWAWRDGSVDRVVLSGDASLMIDGRRFRAAFAAVWFEREADGSGSAWAYVRDFAGATDLQAGEARGERAPLRWRFGPGATPRVRADRFTNRAPADASREERAWLMEAEAARAAPPAREVLGPPPTFRARGARPAAPATEEERASADAPARASAGVTPPAPESPKPAPAPTAPTEPMPEAPPAPSGQASGSTPSRPPARPDPIFAPGGVIAVAPGDVVLVPGEDEHAIVLSGDLAIQYTPAGGGRALQMSASRGVIFADPGPVEDLLRLGAERVRGVYLEGDATASDGQYTVRGTRIYYDVKRDRAILLDAVFWTYDEGRRVPLYARARAIRQVGSSTFEADGAELTNSAFRDPELSLGVGRVTISRRESPAPREGLLGPSGGTRPTTWVEARHVTPRLVGVPFFYWPAYRGDPDQRVVRDVRFEIRSGAGPSVLTTINAYGLLGIRQPALASADLLLDYYAERGPGLGGKGRWQTGTQQGSAFVYGVPSDRGTDVMKPGSKIERDGEFRGVALVENRWRLDDAWTLTAEGAYLSDEAVIDGFFETLGETRREFTNRLAARRLRAHTALTAEVKGTFNDFLANEYLRTSQGFSVSRVPEVTYSRLADSVLLAPGVLTWSQEYRAGRLALAFDEVSAAEHGLVNATLSRAGLGIEPGESLGQVLRGAGLSEEPIYRLDTRQELSLQARAGAVRINPFVVGRATYYDNAFDVLSPEEDEHLRLWGAAGLRLSTTIQRVDDDAESRWLDMHRLRHLIEPSITAWTAGSSVPRAALPLYDLGVEGIGDGAMVRAGITQTLQTQRGGPGRWRSADLLTLSTDYFWSSDRAGDRGPVGRFFDDRPELSNPGEFVLVDAVFRPTDALSLTLSDTYDLEADAQAAVGAGVLVRHGPEYWAGAEVRHLSAQDATFLYLRAGYDLTSTYSANVFASYDTDEREFQTIGAEVRRRFSSMIFGVGVSRNEITGDTGFGFVIRPFGAGGEVGITGLGGDAPGSSIGGR